jgi:lipoprotein-anchoring transpeptidase ErfK/SrfK
VTFWPRTRRTGTAAVARPFRWLQRSGGPRGRAAVTPVPPSVASIVESPGTPLETGVQAVMQERLGRDFSRVRVHTDAAAAETVRGVDAVAYTVGEDVAFDTGRYAPSTDAGRRLLAHELTHVAQQREGLLRQAVAPEPAPDELEREARSAEEALADEWEAEPPGYVPEPIPGGDLPLPTAEELAELVGGEPGEEESEEATATGATAASMLATPVAARRGPRPGPRRVAQAGKKGKPKKRIVVDLGAQEATAFEDNKPVKKMPISSGRKGHETTPGHFKIYGKDKKDKDHRSSTYGECVSKAGRRKVSKGKDSCKKGEKYEGAPMPFFQRFNGAQGLHQGLLPGHPDSHGCVRLSEDNAKWLWDWAEDGTPVDVKAAPAKKKAPAKKP